MTKLVPSVEEFDSLLGDALDHIEPGHRIQIIVPRSLSHERTIGGGECVNGGTFELFEAYFRLVLNRNIFPVVRFDKGDEFGEVIVDIYHLPQ